MARLELALMLTMLACASSAVAMRRATPSRIKQTANYREAAELSAIFARRESGMGIGDTKTRARDVRALKRTTPEN